VEDYGGVDEEEEGEDLGYESAENNGLARMYSRLAATCHTARA
jgi:hypothetical protein